ncbi:hypothetical protein K2173_000337 [Erythroxylum novogranatense]|uniref:peptidyl-tRNA hydrolase n=1 Tax=Erythroxylum novogranatense TaxID=1862640 RepID=A0AAV8SW05_9ROSI|nr:hypothetical protein K2173_000337 [Erythroxylum novogranatense]
MLTCHSCDHLKMATLLSTYRFPTSLSHFTPSIRAIGFRVSTRALTRIIKPKDSMSQTSFESETAMEVTDPANDVVKGNSSDEVVVQYVVLRRDLIDTWPMGSVVTQGCHASVAAIWAYKDDPHTLHYCSPQNIDSMHKVTLEVKGEAQMVNLSEKLAASGIAHKLWVEQPENTPTCLATKPYPKSTVSLFFKRLKLCK